VLESLESRLLLAANWQNPVVSLDVNNDHAISPVDALIPINYINEHGIQPVTAPRQSGEPYPDVSGDNFVSPIDVLQVINSINEGFQLPITLNDPGAVANQKSIVIGLGQAAGSRTYRFEVDTTFDHSDTSATLEDTFVVYLVDKDDPSTTLLDRGVNGTSIFALSGDRADFVPGLVRYDGQVVEIDLTLLADKDQGKLVFQLLNSDSDNGTRVVVRPTSNDVNPDGLQTPTFVPHKAYVAAGDTLDFNALTKSSDLAAVVSNVRYDRASGEYRADVQVHNNGTPTGRDVAVELTGLPSDVSLRNATGTSPSGNPYISFHDAIRSGGLDHGATSDAIEVTLDVTNQARFSWTADLWAGVANQAPVFDPIAPITMMPGASLNVTLSATDPDGDAVHFSLQPADTMPSLTFNGNGSLRLTPTPDQLGSYTFVAIATDGTLQTPQTVTIDVVADPHTMTRISGQVLDTDGTPLAHVPIEVGRFQTTTTAAGSFTLELPSFTVPTDAYDIAVPTGDPQFDPLSEGGKTIPLFRAGYDTSTGTSAANPRQFPNLVSTFLDGSVVYGSDPARAAALRTNDGTGKLKMSTGDLLPLNNSTYFPDGPLENENDSHVDPATLFAAGDVRVNDNPALLSLQTLLVREHNRKADELKAADPNLTGDALYEQARRWVGALLQHITYDEFLPLLLGKDSLPTYSGYDAAVDPRISALFSVAAFRFGHSTSLSELPRLDDNGDSLSGGPLSLLETFFNPEPIANDGIEPYLRGMATQQIAEIDPQIIDDLRNFLFGPPGAGGLDLGAIDIQRGRDMGLPSFNQTRRDLGLTPAATFADVTSNADLQTALAAVYASVEDVDLFVGGLAEDHKAEAMVGETFWTILQDQFQRLRGGDRLWYENSQFTAADLQAIRDTTMTDLIERNTDITGLATNVFTISTAPAAPTPGGNAASQTPTELRSLDGSGNNLTDPALGARGSDLLVNYTPGYAYGISTPAGPDLPNARAISNALFDQTSSALNSRGATNLFAIWGQLVAHDTGLSPGGTDNTIKVHGDSLTGADSYPFVAERLPLMLDHPAYVSVDNVILRPIYLPKLDVAGGTTIDPNQDTMVQQEIAPGEMATLEVAAGTLQNRDDTMFDGLLSITEVPRALTPAALPANLLPDTVVTIQPADMVFTQPAPLTFPNRSGWPPGTEMDLWSINPVTGEFDDVGDGRVSSDGLRIETISGGVRNSSWHFFARLVEAVSNMLSKTQNIDENCPSCIASEKVNSQVELHSGAIIETHELVTYSSLGATRGLTLRYDSANADPQPILHFGFDNAVGDGRMLAANLTFTRGGLSMLVDGYSGAGLSEGGFHFWQLPSGTNTIEAALQGDLASSPTGVYDYTLKQGLLLRAASGALTGTLSESSGSVTVVNDINSQFGAGWQLGGLQRLVENPDGSILLIDGGGLTLRFMPPAAAGESYNSPSGDFTTLIKNADGSYSRTLTDQTVYEFNAAGLLQTVSDRLGNVTEFVYASGLLSEIIDPVGLHTTLTYVNNRVSKIADPAGRVTRLSYDTAGNLVTIEDPDGSQRNFQYDDRHHLTAETDQRGSFEQTFYGFHGRAESSLRKDGAELTYSPLQTRILQPPELTASPVTAPMASIVDPTASAIFVDSNGNVEVTQLDQQGQAVSRADSLGDLPTIARNESNLVVRSTDARGYATIFEYDEFGNVISIGLPAGESAGSVTRLRSGETVTASLDGGGTSGGLTADVDVYTLDAEAGDELLVNFQEAGGFNYLQGIVYAPDGTRLDEATTGSGHAFTLSNLASSGTYTVVVRAANGDETGNYNLTATVIDAELEADNVDLVSGETVAAGLTIGDIDSFTIDAQAGDELLVNFQDAAFFNNLQGIVYAPDGTRLDDATTGYGHAFTFSNLASSGKYTIVVRAAYGNETGNYNLTATVIDSTAEADNVDLASGETVAAGLTNGDIDSFTIDAQAGDELLVNFQDAAFFNYLQGIVYAPDGTRLDEATTGSGHAFTLSNLASSGTYTVVVRAANGDETGNYNLTATVIDAELEADNVDLVSGETVAAGLTIGDIDSFTIDAQAGDELLVNFQDAAFFNNLQGIVYAPDGTRLDDATTGYGHAFTFSNLASSGKYTIVVRAAYGNETGNYNLTATVIDSTAEADNVDLASGETVAAGLTNGDIDSFTIDAQAGDELLVNFQDAAFFNYLQGIVYAPDGTRLDEATTGSGHAFTLSNLVAPGTYTVVVRAANGAETGNYTIVGTINGSGSGTRTVTEADPREITEAALTAPADTPTSVIETARAVIETGRTLSAETATTITDIASLAVNEPAPTEMPAEMLAPGNRYDGQLQTAGEEDELLIELAAGGDLLLSVSASYQIEVTISDPAGNSVATETGRRFVLDIVDVTVPGDYRIRLRAANGNSTGNYRISYAKLDKSFYESLGQPQTFTYDPTFNQLTSSVDELGHATLYEVDPVNGNRLAMREVIGQVDDASNGETDDLLTTFTYTPQGLVDTITDPQGRLTDFDYTLEGLVSSVTFAVGTADEASQSFAYDAAGNQTAIVDENGNRTEFQYDELNRLTQITEADPDGTGPLTAPLTTFSYDARGNLIETSDAAGSTTINQYEALDRLVLSRDELDHETRLSYDHNGNIVTAVDPNGNTSRYRYDARDRRVETLDPDGGATTFQYDADNNLISLTDPNGNATTFTYDGRDRLTRESDPLGAVTRYSYDAVDNLIRQVDRDGRTTEFAYDDVNRPTTEMWIKADGSVANTIDYAYDKVSNLLSVVDDFSSLAFAYDARNRVTSVDNAGTLAASGLPNVVLDYTYDDVGNVLSESETIDSIAGATTAYQYDALNRMSSVQQSGGGTNDKLVDMVYNELGQFVQISRYSDLARSNLVARSDYQYDGLNRLTSLDHTDATDAAIAFYDFEYDPASRITAITDVDGRTDYAYDDRDQLTGADRDAADPRGDESYTYDANGNRIDSHLHGAGYVTGPANRLLSDGTFDYEYDAEGNLVRRTNISTGDFREMRYDHRNRLVSVTDFSSGGIITQDVRYTYDALDRRIAKTADGAGANFVQTTHFVYDRENVLLDVADADGSGTVEQPQLTHRYLLGSGVDQVLAQELVNVGQTQWLLTDHLGTVRDILSDNGMILNHIQYDSFGNVLSQSDPSTSSRYLFTGREFDPETGLFYYRARYYDANIGRFLSEDPLRVKVGDTTSYRYVANMPMLYVDPFGLEQKYYTKEKIESARVGREKLLRFIPGYTTNAGGGDFSNWLRTHPGMQLDDIPSSTVNRILEKQQKDAKTFKKFADAEVINVVPVLPSSGIIGWIENLENNLIQICFPKQKKSK
jgi:RHS repeat-associated protein